MVQLSTLLLASDFYLQSPGFLIQTPKILMVTVMRRGVCVWGGLCVLNELQSVHPEEHLLSRSSEMKQLDQDQVKSSNWIIISVFLDYLGWIQRWCSISNQIIVTINSLCLSNVFWMSSINRRSKSSFEGCSAHFKLWSSRSESRVLHHHNAPWTSETSNTKFLVLWLFSNHFHWSRTATFQFIRHIDGCELLLLALDSSRGQ